VRTDGPRCVTGCIVAAALALFAGCFDGASQPLRPQAAGVRTERIGPREIDLTVPSKAVGADVQVRLLLPQGYDREPERRWPVLYLLHGCCDSYDSWTRSTDVERLSARDDVLVVMPDGDPVGFYSDWIKGPAWERFHVGELRRLLEERYRAADARAIAGLSMGGLGAMAYAARNPGGVPCGGVVQRPPRHAARSSHERRHHRPRR
jgi:S-formylglutathione hydrolase FrmB